MPPCPAGIVIGHNDLLRLSPAFFCDNPRTGKNALPTGEWWAGGLLSQTDTPMGCTKVRDALFGLVGEFFA